ncbi:hypothetical protein ACTFIZ_009242 [Dictyostelium cf. discoideum]
MMQIKIQKIADPYSIGVPCGHTKGVSSNHPCKTCISNNQINLSYQPIALLPNKKVYHIIDSKIGSVNKIILPYKFSQCNSIHSKTIYNFLNSKLNYQKSNNSLRPFLSSIINNKFK